MNRPERLHCIDAVSKYAAHIIVERMGVDSELTFTLLDTGGRRSTTTTSVQLLQDGESRTVVLSWDSFDEERVLMVDRVVFDILSDHITHATSASRLQEINPSTFYTDICNTGIFRIFPKQDQAFAIFDDLIKNGKARGRRLKIFSFEGVSSGVRKFAVAEFGRFGMRSFSLLQNDY
jgi:hypothetical protein